MAPGLSRPAILRGRIYLAPLEGAGDDGGDGMKYWLCVSNNVRNSRLDEFIAVRCTTTRRDLPSWVPLGTQDTLSGGYVACDDIGPIMVDEVVRDVGAVSAATMVKVADAIRYVLSL